MTQISLDKNILNKQDFEKLVDVKFKQLINQNNIEDAFTIEEFFQLYDELFSLIPIEGTVNSHRYILNREAEYLGITLNDGVNVQALLDEITNLRSELLAANKVLINTNIK